MSKEIEIRAVGYGQELVQGSFSDEEVEILENKMDESDETLGSLIFDIESILPDSYGWYERDDHTHVYGGLVDAITFYIVDGEKEIKVDNILDLEEDPYNVEIESEEVYVFEGTENIITSISNEKGWIISTTIKIKDGEEFNMSKLKLKIKDIIFNDYENSLLCEIIYDGEEIYFDSDTRGKSFGSYLDRKEKVVN